MIYNIKNIVLEKLYTKCDGERSPRPRYKKLSISLNQQSEMLYNLFFLHVLVEVNQNILGTEQISLPDYLNFLIYWVICVL